MNQASDKFKFLMLIFKTGVIIGRKFSGQGLSFADLAILYAIDQAPEGKIRSTELAEQVGLPASGLTRLLNPLEKIGIVKIEAYGRDVRASFVVMTESGKGLFGNALKFAEMRCADLIPEEQEKKLELANTLLRSIVQ